MRTSKYVGKMFDGNWICTAIGIANVQGKRSKAPGARNHYYIFERRTSDDKADKIIRLSSTEAAKVYHGKILVEQLLNERESKPSKKVTKSVTYHFGN